MSPSKPREYEIERAHERLTELLDKEIAYTALRLEAEALARVLERWKRQFQEPEDRIAIVSEESLLGIHTCDALARFDVWREKHGTK